MGGLLSWCLVRTPDRCEPEEDDARVRAKVQGRTLDGGGHVISARGVSFASMIKVSRSFEVKVQHDKKWNDNQNKHKEHP